jgi:hypothetical protein
LASGVPTAGLAILMMAFHRAPDRPRDEGLYARHRAAMEAEQEAFRRWEEVSLHCVAAERAVQEARDAAEAARLQAEARRVQQEYRPRYDAWLDAARLLLRLEQEGQQLYPGDPTFRPEPGERRRRS